MQTNLFMQGKGSSVQQEFIECLESNQFAKLLPLCHCHMTHQLHHAFVVQ